MTKEELAKKKGLKLNKEISPAESLITTTIPKPVEIERTVNLTNEIRPVVKAKRPVGKPKKRKDGDKKISFWLDAELVDKLYSSLNYGDTASEFINKALKEYLRGN